MYIYIYIYDISEYLCVYVSAISGCYRVALLLYALFFSYCYCCLPYSRLNDGEELDYELMKKFYNA